MTVDPDALIAAGWCAAGAAWATTLPDGVDPDAVAALLAPAVAAWRTDPDDPPREDDRPCPCP